MSSELMPVSDDAARRFLDEAFRNIELPPLSRADLRDIADALAAWDIRA